MPTAATAQTVIDDTITARIVILETSLQAIKGFRYQMPNGQLLADQTAHLLVGTLQVIRPTPLSTYLSAFIMAGVVHTRALLEFMGLGFQGGRLAQVCNGRRPDDCRITDLCDAQGRPLPTVTLQQAINALPDTSEGEMVDAFADFYRFVNKELAHVTMHQVEGATFFYLEKVMAAVLALVHCCIVVPCGRQDYVAGQRGTSKA